MADEEPTITINGHPINSAQAMAVRVAVSSFHTEMGAPDALGDDEHGRLMAAAYRARLTEVLRLFGRIAP